MELKSVEFLMEQLFDPSWKEGIEIQKKWFETAKEMQKKEIKNAYNSGQESNWSEDMGLMGDWYYDETFNNEL